MGPPNTHPPPPPYPPSPPTPPHSPPIPPPLPKKLQLHRRVLAFFLSCTAGLIHDEPGQYSIRLSEFLSFADGKQITRVKNLKTTF